MGHQTKIFLPRNRPERLLVPLDEVALKRKYDVQYCPDPRLCSSTSSTHQSTTSVATDNDLQREMEHALGPSKPGPPAQFHPLTEEQSDEGPPRQPPIVINRGVAARNCLPCKNISNSTTGEDRGPHVVFSRKLVLDSTELDNAMLPRGEQSPAILKPARYGEQRGKTRKLRLKNCLKHQGTSHDHHELYLMSPPPSPHARELTADTGKSQKERDKFSCIKKEKVKSTSPAPKELNRDQTKMKRPNPQRKFGRNKAVVDQRPIDTGDELTKSIDNKRGREKYLAALKMFSSGNVDLRQQKSDATSPRNKDREKNLTDKMDERFGAEKDRNQRVRGSMCPRGEDREKSPLIKMLGAGGVSSSPQKYSPCVPERTQALTCDTFVSQLQDTPQTDGAHKRQYSQEKSEPNNAVTKNGEHDKHSEQKIKLSLDVLDDGVASNKRENRGLSRKAKEVKNDVSENVKVPENVEAKAESAEGKAAPALEHPDSARKKILPKEKRHANTENSKKAKEDLQTSSTPKDDIAAKSGQEPQNNSYDAKSQSIDDAHKFKHKKKSTEKSTAPDICPANSRTQIKNIARENKVREERSSRKPREHASPIEYGEHRPTPQHSGLPAKNCEEGPSKQENYALLFEVESSKASLAKDDLARTLARPISAAISNTENPERPLARAVVTETTSEKHPSKFPPKVDALNRVEESPYKVFQVPEKSSPKGAIHETSARSDVQESAVQPALKSDT
ncbi:hypothetical protein BIW11_12503, partial [Tropilaelaps mercedesae]